MVMRRNRSGAPDLRTGYSLDCVPLLSIYRRDGKKVVPVTPERINSQLDLVRDLGFPGAGLFSNQRLSPELEAALAARSE